MALKVLGSPRVARTSRPPYFPTTGLYCSRVTNGIPTFGAPELSAEASPPPVACAAGLSPSPQPASSKPAIRIDRTSEFLRFPMPWVIPDLHQKWPVGSDLCRFPL